MAVTFDLVDYPHPASVTLTINGVTKNYPLPYKTKDLAEIETFRKHPGMVEVDASGNVTKHDPKPPAPEPKKEPEPPEDKPEAKAESKEPAQAPDAMAGLSPKGGDVE